MAGSDRHTIPSAKVARSVIRTAGLELLVVIDGVIVFAVKVMCFPN